MIEVIDSGPGIADDVLPRLFGTVFSTRPMPHPPGQPPARPYGLGLGLSPCQSPLQRMGGEITAGNRDQGGAVFTVILFLGLRIAKVTHESGCHCLLARHPSG